jgi:hypothetical protein
MTLRNRKAQGHHEKGEGKTAMPLVNIDNKAIIQTDNLLYITINSARWSATCYFQGDLTAVLQFDDYQSRERAMDVLLQAAGFQPPGH